MWPKWVIVPIQGYGTTFHHKILLWRSTQRKRPKRNGGASKGMTKTKLPKWPLCYHRPAKIVSDRYIDLSFSNEKSSSWKCTNPIERYSTYFQWLTMHSWLILDRSWVLHSEVLQHKYSEISILKIRILGDANQYQPRFSYQETIAHYR